jgi:hypothetical protein
LSRLAISSSRLENTSALDFGSAVEESGAAADAAITGAVMRGSAERTGAAGVEARGSTLGGALGISIEG